MVLDRWDQSAGDGDGQHPHKPAMTDIGREEDGAWDGQASSDLHAWTDSGRRTEKIKDKVM